MKLAVFDSAGAEIPDEMFKDVSVDKAGTCRFTFCGPAPVTFSKVVHPNGTPQPGSGIPVPPGALFVVPAAPAGRVVMQGDVIRNGNVVRDNLWQA